MREKIIARLKAKYSGVNLSQKRMDAIADKLAAKITEESEIDGKLDELNDIMPFADIARDDDRLRTLDNKRPKDQPKPTPQDQPDKDNPPADDMPPWFKKYVEENKKEMEAMRTQNFQGTITSRLAKDLKDIPAKFYSKRALPTKEEDYEAFIQEVTSDYNEFKDEQVAAGLMSATKPADGKGGAPTESKTVDADITAWAKSNQPTPAPTTT